MLFLGFTKPCTYLQLALSIFIQLYQPPSNADLQCKVVRFASKFAHTVP